MAATFLRRRRNHVGVERGKLHLHRLAGRRAGARRRHLDQHAGDVGGFLADRVHDRVRLRPRLPVRELELDHADRVLGDLGEAARLLAGARIDGLHARKRQHPLLDGAHGAVLLLEREVAAAVDDRPGRNPARPWGRTRRRGPACHRPSAPRSAETPKAPAWCRDCAAQAAPCACRGRDPPCDRGAALSPPCRAARRASG